MSSTRNAGGPKPPSLQNFRKVKEDIDKFSKDKLKHFAPGNEPSETNPTIEPPPPNKTTSFASQNLIGVEDRIHRDSKGLQPLKTPPSYTQGPVI